MPLWNPNTRCKICHDTGWKHNAYCEVGACNVECQPCPKGCSPKFYTPNGDEVATGPAIRRPK